MIRVQVKDFDVAHEYESLRNSAGRVGAICTFTGLVRDFGDSRGLTGMFLEHYPGMTEKQLEKIEAEARNRWELNDCLVIHRYGRMEVSEPIVLVITTSAHRKDAFAAAEFLMDWLKTQAPFWKLEEGDDGNASWVEERQSDVDAAQKWDQSN